MRTVLPLIAPALLAVGMATALAPTAMACGPGEDINTLCSTEQQFLNDLAAIGIKPTSTPKELATTAQMICGVLINGFKEYPGPDAGAGIKNRAASDLRRGNPTITWEQAQGWVQAAVNNVCPDRITGMHYD